MQKTLHQINKRNTVYPYTRRFDRTSGQNPERKPFEAGERCGKALDMSLDVIKKTPHIQLKKSTLELHYGRTPRTGIRNLLNLDKIEKLTNCSVSDSLQIYSFSGAGGVSDQLLMKSKKNQKELEMIACFSENKHQRSKFESAYSDKPHLAISGTNYTVPTPNRKILHSKTIS